MQSEKEKQVQEKKVTLRVLQTRRGTDKKDKVEEEDENVKSAIYHLKK